MIKPTIKELLKYADLQMAAEAFLTSETDSGNAPLTGKNLIDALIRGNKHASKFTKPQATRFLEHWKVLAQQPNTGSGFSGTVFECIKDDPLTGATVGERVVSFRSTEFLDDYARDNAATNALEIKETGFAWGQLRDMEAWYQQLLSNGTLERGNFSVTGYSLGGHLASAFNTMHPADAQQVVTFNGAGIGGYKPDATLGELVGEFARLAQGNPDGSSAFSFAAPELTALYQRMRADVKAGRPVAPSDLVRLNQMADVEGPFKSNGEAFVQAVLVQRAVARLSTIEGEVDYIATVKLPEPVDQVGLLGVSQHDLDYQMAVLTVARKTDAASVLGGLERAYLGKVYAGQEKRANQFDVVGDTIPSAVANSQYHIGTDVRVFIEDQPLYRGGLIDEVAWKSLRTMGLKLLVDRYDLKDFGDTHSLVLLVDSLNLQSTLLKMLPPGAAASSADLLRTVLQETSNLRAKNGDAVIGLGQGKAEGDVLERAANALADLVLGGANFRAGKLALTPLVGSDEGNLWHEVDPTEGEIRGQEIRGHGNSGSPISRLRQVAIARPGT